MGISAKAVRKQLTIFKPLVGGFSLKTIRKGQEKIGEFMKAKYREQVIVKKQILRKENSEADYKGEGDCKGETNCKEAACEVSLEGAWIMPKDERREGIILYLHGGGYTCGGLEYATGFGSLLAVQSGARVFSVAYRLAPENPFPAAVDDAVEAYKYLLGKGYSNITVCGESAGGGLCYSLCLKLKELRLKEPGLQMPCGIVAMSPWVDLTASGESYKTNKENDPTLTEELLNFYADSYTKDRRNPMVSPLLADLQELEGMPPSLIFAGSDEILLSDAEMMHKWLVEAGNKSKLIVARDRWHAYLLYDFDEDSKDFALINRFLNQVMSQENKLRWMPLDNAAKIYPAARRESWSNVFRLSATLTEEIDMEIMRGALDVTVRRFPSIAVRLRKGLFWYYLQQLSEPPEIREENSYPLARMSKEETRKCAFRVIVYGRRIAVEFFHSLTDGNGALVFLKSLVAEYLEQKYGIDIPAEHGVLARLEEPSPAELEDSYQKHVGTIAASRKENTAWRLTGTPEENGFLNVTCFELPVQDVLDKAHEYGVSLNNFLCATMMLAMQNMQEEKEPNPKRRKPIKVLIPVNLRKMFNSRSLRNFALYITPEILPKLGRYDFDEICRVIHSYMELENTPKQMSMKIATNVNSERVTAIKVMPLFVKNFVMKAIFDTVGERKSCMTVSNLGAVKLPEKMTPYVERMDFILGVQATAPYNCGVLSYGETLYINVIKNIQESELEQHLYRVLKEFGLAVKVQSNQQSNQQSEQQSNQQRE